MITKVTKITKEGLENYVDGLDWYRLAAPRFARWQE